jgi:ribosome-binding factor A
LRLAPEISFKPDESVAHAAHIENLLSKIKEGNVPPDGDADT